MTMKNTMLLTFALLLPSISSALPPDPLFDQSGKASASTGVLAKASASALPQPVFGQGQLSPMVFAPVPLPVLAPAKKTSNGETYDKIRRGLGIGYWISFAVGMLVYGPAIFVALALLIPKLYMDLNAKPKTPALPNQALVDYQNYLWQRGKTVADSSWKVLSMTAESESMRTLSVEQIRQEIHAAANEERARLARMARYKSPLVIEEAERFLAALEQEADRLAANAKTADEYHGKLVDLANSVKLWAQDPK